MIDEPGDMPFCSLAERKTPSRGEILTKLKTDAGKAPVFCQNRQYDSRESSISSGEAGREDSGLCPIRLPASRGAISLRSKQLSIFFIILLLKAREGAIPGLLRGRGRLSRGDGV